MEDKKITLELPLNMVQVLLNIIADPVFKQKSLIVGEIERQTQNQLRTKVQDPAVTRDEAYRTKFEVQDREITRDDKDNNKVS